MMNENEFDDIIIPPPSQFADIVWLDNVIISRTFPKHSSPDSDVIEYVMDEQYLIVNYLNKFQDIKYQI